MRFPVATMMIGLGYAVVYWALMRIYAFGPSDGTAIDGLSGSKHHSVARMDILLGIPGAQEVVISQPPVHIGTAGYASPSSGPATGGTGGTQSI